MKRAPRGAPLMVASPDAVALGVGMQAGTEGCACLAVLDQHAVAAVHRTCSNTDSF